MELKEYQKKTLEQVKRYLEALAEFRAKNERLIKDDPEEGKALILDMAAQLYGVALILEPFMPTTSKVILGAVEENKKPENLFPRLID